MFLSPMETGIPNDLSIDLLSADNIIFIPKIPVKLAWEQEESLSTMSWMVYKKIGVEFGNLSNKQKNQLDKLIVIYTAGYA